LRGTKNIGLTIEKRLNEIGVFSLADLAQVTPVKAYQKICKQHPEKTFPVCYYLYSLQGALLDLHWNNLPTKLKAELRKQVGR
jgi:DNA transformation protein and related proteins